MTGPEFPLTRQQALLLTAHHEAAHAVIAHHKGIQLISLHLDNTGDADTWHVGGITHVIYHPSLAAQFATQGAAGEIAALKWLDDHGLRTPATEDLANADHDRDDVLSLTAKDGIRIDWSAAQHRAQTLVRSLWPQISAVAHAAAESGDLTSAQVIELITTRSALGFRQQHGALESWTTADFETEINLAEIDALTPTDPDNLTTAA
ncbi:hypothetical protein [Streptomyces violaceorubidus]|uniref:hypothetical protein n=1 Tax=Streptomyces violaceorubidus TaxID=284042 RepID=UPI0004BF7DD4|nr:hypothetical protein [Streptomyces violaceorubidus]